MKQYEQGDVIFKPAKIDLSGAIPEKHRNGRWIIAEGEVTGHAHAIKESEAIVYQKDGKRYVLTEKGFTITHEEHGPIVVEPGIYEIGIVKEFDYFTMESRNVAD